MFEEYRAHEDYGNKNLGKPQLIPVSIVKELEQPIDPTLPITVIERIIRRSGAARVSRDAGIELAKILETYAADIAKDAITLMRHAGRNTIRPEDIRMAHERKLK